MQMQMRVARAEAFKAIEKAIRRLDSGEDSPPGKAIHSIDDAIVYLGQRVKLFASTPTGQAGEFTPHPATWFNQKRYLDDDAEWQRRANGKGSFEDKWDAFARKHAAAD
jgi:hypothetical protein